MRTRPPELDDEQVAGALAAGWRLAVDALAYAPVGFGSHHWRVTAGGDRWFATVDDLAAKRWRADEPLSGPRERLAAALTTARLLRDGGLDFVVAPVAAGGGDVLVPLGDRWAMALYPHVDGRPHAWGRYPDRAARLAVVDLVARLHRAPATAWAGARPDGLVLPHRDGLEAALAGAAGPGGPGPYAAPAHDLVARHAGAVRAALARYDRLVALVRARPDRRVLTHGEPHRANTITTPAGPVLIDWETALVAAPERDLWSLAAEDDRTLGDYAERTGTVPDPDALALYRLAWDLSEVAGYRAWFHRPHRDTEDARTAWDGLRGYLEVVASGP